MYSLGAWSTFTCWAIHLQNVFHLIFASFLWWPRKFCLFSGRLVTLAGGYIHGNLETCLFLSISLLLKWKNTYQLPLGSAVIWTDDKCQRNFHKYHRKHGSKTPVKGCRVYAQVWVMQTVTLKPGHTLCKAPHGIWGSSPHIHVQSKAGTRGDPFFTQIHLITQVKFCQWVTSPPRQPNNLIKEDFLPRTAEGGWEVEAPAAWVWCEDCAGRTTGPRRILTTLGLNGGSISFLSSSSQLISRNKGCWRMSPLTPRRFSGSLTKSWKGAEGEQLLLKGWTRPLGGRCTS